MDEYSDLIEKIGNRLRSLDFKKRGTTFYLKKGENFGLINFQKTRSPRPNEISFTVNLGVFSTKIGNFLGGYRLNKPDIGDCHWRIRVGELMPQKQDYWWKIIPFTDLQDLQNEVENIVVKLCVPEIVRHIADDDLLNMWSSNISGGITSFQRYIYMTTLLKAYNRPNLLDAMEELRIFSAGKPIEDVAIKHLNRLKS